MDPGSSKAELLTCFRVQLLFLLMESGGDFKSFIVGKRVKIFSIKRTVFTVPNAGLCGSI